MMTYIDLNTVNEDHLKGVWEVKNRFINNNNADNPFVDIRVLEIDTGDYRSVNGKERRGKWQMVREHQIIYNPQIKFYIEQQPVGNAIITRLQSETDINGNTFKLTLYFSNGLELVLQKTAM